MKIVQEINLPDNCKSCIQRAADAGQPFKCSALEARAGLQRINAEADGLEQLEKSRSDLATPILQRMLGVAVAFSISSWSQKNPNITDVENGMKQCAGPVVYGVESYTAADSLIFSSLRQFRYKAERTDNEVTEPKSEYTIVSTDLLDPTKYETTVLEVGEYVGRVALISPGDVDLQRVYNAAETVRSYAQKIIIAAK